MKRKRDAQKKPSVLAVRVQAKASLREASTQAQAKSNAQVRRSVCASSTQVRASMQAEAGMLAKTDMRTNARTKAKPLRKAILVAAFALAAVVALAACTEVGDTPQPSGSGSYEGVTTVVRAELPAKPAADDYEAQDELLGANALDEKFTDGLSAFSYRSAATVLGEKPQANGNFSPVSLYLALAMVQMGAAGETRDQIAAALGSSDAAATAEQCGNLMRLLATDHLSDVRLANSVWMRPDAQFKQPFVDAMRDQFYASLFLADFGTDAADKAMAQWIADNTEGTLAPTFRSQEGQLLSLIDTVYFKSEWAKAFEAEATEPGLFAVEGGDVQAAFMAQRLDRPQEIRQTETYTRASLGFVDGSVMTFVLPAEGADVQDLLADGALLEEAFASDATGEAFVTYRVPKFAFDSSYGLIPALEQLGVVAAFGDQADFSNLTDTPAYVSSVAQESHIGLDENGVEASAYTKVDIMEMSALPDPSVDGELELNLDRPFLYGIRTRQGVPLFIGICAQPDEAT